MTKKSIIIFGSSRANGHTMHAVEAFNVKSSTPVLNLDDFNFSMYDYTNSNIDDDYIGLIENIIHYKTIVLATPVYWYTMSAQMKKFIDRLTDCVTVRKDLGRKLSNKNLLVLASWGGSVLNGFEWPFVNLCKYMNMNYKGCFFHYSGNNKYLLRNNKMIVSFINNTMY